MFAANVANDYFKRLHAGKRGGDAVGPLESAEWSASATSDDAASVERELLIKEVNACLRRAATGETRERDCAIFSLYFRQGLKAKEIAAIPWIGLGIKGVESTLHRLVRLVRTQLVETRRREGKGFPGDSRY